MRKYRDEVIFHPCCAVMKAVKVALDFSLTPGKCLKYSFNRSLEPFILISRVTTQLYLCHCGLFLRSIFWGFVDNFFTLFGLRVYRTSCLHTKCRNMKGIDSHVDVFYAGFVLLLILVDNRFFDISFVVQSLVRLHLSRAQKVVEWQVTCR